MEANQIEQKVKGILALQGGLESDSIGLDDKTKDWGFDSLDDVEIIMSCEEEFDIEISDEEAAKVETVQDLMELVQSKI